MCCAIWYNFKKVKKSLGGVLLLVKLQALACNITKSNVPLLVFFCFLIVQMVHKACNFTKSNTPPGCLFQIKQMVPNRATHQIFIFHEIIYTRTIYLKHLKGITQIQYPNYSTQGASKVTF